MTSYNNNNPQQISGQGVASNHNGSVGGNRMNFED